ncbi:MAG: phospho-N-acetylmuramoyl-pentapeptide-transferase [Acidobacteriota bacterium]|nr:phospho-N-acetylmuramoyl-pentapeptide-transferase [Acidobacteriota bacterium]
MFYGLLHPLKDIFSAFNVFRYITVRTALAGVTAMLICLLAGPWLINLLRRKQIGQEIRTDGPQSHLAKKGTPTMGGILIIAATIIPTLLWGNLSNTYVWLAIGTMITFGIVGWLDDYLKVIRRRSLGLIARYKLALQIGLAVAFGAVVMLLGRAEVFDLHLSLPIFKSWLPYLGWLYWPWIVLILVGSSNAVNLADGLDGLATGLTLISSAALTALTYIAGHAIFSKYLYVARVPMAAELTVFGGALTGACLGFLWFNSHPAQVFMGDVGALSLGATLAMISILIKQEFLLFSVAGVFIIELLSVAIQVSYFRLSGGKRVFRMAPLHHHFELLGWPEEKVVIRFWILGLIFALFTLTTLKLR